jgi:hypothetical protein
MDTEITIIASVGYHFRRLALSDVMPIMSYDRIFGTFIDIDEELYYSWSTTISNFQTLAGIPSRREVLDESDRLSFRNPIVGSWGYLVREIPDHFVWIQFLRKEYVVGGPAKSDFYS